MHTPNMRAFLFKRVRIMYNRDSCMASHVWVRARTHAPVYEHARGHVHSCAHAHIGMRMRIKQCRQAHT